MFSFKYFMINAVVGFLAGVFPNPSAVTTVFNLIGIGMVIWTFATFGASWGFLALGEVFLGAVVGVAVRKAGA